MSSTRSTVALRRALTVLAGALAATVVALALGMPAARAHDELVATTPAQDATVTTPPSAVTLEFSQAVQPLGARVLVSAPGGAPVSRGAVEVRDGSAVQPLVVDAPVGRYTVTWRVTSSDGHPLSGEFAFIVAAGAPTAAAAPSAEEPANGGGDDADLSETAAPQARPAASPVGPIAVGAALVAIAGGLVVFLRRRRP